MTQYNCAANWDDLMYGIFVVQKIEAGLRDSENKNNVDVSEVRKKFGLETQDKK